MFPIWLFLGGVLLVMGLFNKQMLRWMGLKPMSEVFTTPSLRSSSRQVEQIGKWLVVALGMAFLVHGLGSTLPGRVASAVSSLFVDASALLLVAMFVIAIANWKTR
jgi:hypothetical protein